MKLEWLIKYLCVAHGCDTPILESFFISINPPYMKFLELMPRIKETLTQFGYKEDSYYKDGRWVHSNPYRLVYFIPGRRTMTCKDGLKMIIRFYIAQGTKVGFWIQGTPKNTRHWIKNENEWLEKIWCMMKPDKTFFKDK